ncbi:carbonic anhydrase 1-like isoform X2 [Zootermopsis nevadensis]|uniref:carbonic anhydrase 1-like isoform X2 n=1 Tax=Zootermopsis nevadensis TaxID=136037 RepID=UPI000B8ED58D|nr:carbonic anhydrase 1-like isoform X2 [Zootermopsis nevadensis]
MPNFSFTDLFLVCGCTIVVGPHTWRNYYPECDGKNQSPINLMTKKALVVNDSDDLLWFNYHIPPSCIKIFNDGQTVLVRAQWPEALWPTIICGPLNEQYGFHTILFRWGPEDEEGSEHTVDNRSYAMELQMVHVKKGFTTPLSAIRSGAKDGLVIVSFLFKLMPVDNPLLDRVVYNLWRITSPGSNVTIPAFPLNWFFEPFCSNYYTYNGSLTHPPCSESVLWIIQPEALAISSRQLAEFRKLMSHDGRMTSNSRPVQKNSQDVYFYSSN